MANLTPIHKVFNIYKFTIDIIYGDRKIPAIKAVRAAFSLDLREAKEMVERGRFETDDFNQVVKLAFCLDSEGIGCIFYCNQGKAVIECENVEKYAKLLLQCAEERKRKLLF